MKRVILSGGNPHQVLVSVKKNLEACNIEVVAHWEWDPRNASPKDVDAILLFPEVANSKLQGATRAIGHRCHIPVLSMGRKWSSMRPILEQNGLTEVDDKAPDDTSEEVVRASVVGIPEPKVVVASTTTAPSDVRISPSTDWAAYYRKDRKIWYLQGGFAGTSQTQTLTVGNISKAEADMCVVGITAIALGKPSAKGCTVNVLMYIAQTTKKTSPGEKAKASREEARRLILDTLLDVAKLERQDANPLAPVSEVVPKFKPQVPVVAQARASRELRPTLVTPLPEIKNEDIEAEIPALLRAQPVLDRAAEKAFVLDQVTPAATMAALADIKPESKKEETMAAPAQNPVPNSDNATIQRKLFELQLLLRGRPDIVSLSWSKSSDLFSVDVQVVQTLNWTGPK